ncbi:MAG: TonB-dependent receptor [Gemmatimonadetes bacterium]|nr:TonB-dependent receptor [Gemmatimonadota bacterium]
MRHGSPGRSRIVASRRPPPLPGAGGILNREARLGTRAPLAPLSLAFVLTTTAPLAGQTPRPATVPGGDTVSAYQLDSLVVELLRTPVRANQAPYSIAALGRADLFGAKAAGSLDEMLEGLPGVEIQNRFNDAVGERISIRGFGSRATFGVRGVKVLVDGVPATIADGQATLDHVDFGSLGRVEALRGPASMLWGSAAGGVLLLESRRAPETVPYQQTARLVGGSNGQWTGHTTAAGRTGTLGWLAAVGRTQGDGFRPNPLEPEASFSHSEKTQANATLDWQGARDRLRASFNFTRMDAQNPGSLADSVFRSGSREALRFNVLQGASKQIDQAQAGLSWTHELEGERTFEVSGYGITRALDNPITTVVIDLDRRAGGLSAQLSDRVASVARGLRWSLGGQVDLQRDARLNYENDGGTAGALALDQVESVRGTGVFANALLELGAGWLVSGGLRYDRTTFDVEDRFLSDGRDDSGERTMDALSPAVGVRWESDRTFSVYGNVATSFVTPTTTELANRPDGQGGFNADVDPTTAVSVELGARGWVGRTLAWQLALFRTALDDELVPFEVPSEPGRRFFRNAGSSRYYGIEALVHGRIGEHLSGRLTYSYLDGRYQQFRTDTEDFTDNVIPGAAPHRLDGLLRAAGGVGFVEVHAEYADRIAVDDANSQFSDAYTLIDVRGGVDGGAWTVGRAALTPFAGVTNLFDRVYASAVSVNAFGARYYEPGPGRRFYVGLEAAWPGTGF